MTIPRFAAVAAGALLAGLMSGCTSTDARCEQVKTETATSVAGVVSAEFTCQDTPTGSRQQGSVVVAAETDAEAVQVMELVLRAFAAEPRMEPEWRAPSRFSSADGAVVVNPNALGLPGDPWVSELREHYGIEPVR